MLLPESFVVRASFYRRSTRAYLPALGLTVHKPAGLTTANPSPEFTLRVGLHATNQASKWRGVTWA